MAQQQQFLEPTKNTVRPIENDGGGGGSPGGGSGPNTGVVDPIVDTSTIPQGNGDVLPAPPGADFPIYGTGNPDGTTTVGHDQSGGDDQNTSTVDPIVDTSSNSDFLPATDPIQGNDPVSADLGGENSGPSDGSAPGYLSNPSGKPAPLEAGEVPQAGKGPGPYSESGANVDVAQWEVTDEQTVAGQLEKNYDKGSPFMEKASEKAQRRHLAAGGQNSLMAGEAGQLAAMDTAFKVSFADASTYARSAEFNTAMKNQFGLAEQRFIHNSLLSDQNFLQGIELQTQMIAGQLEGIRMEYEGKGILLDQQHINFFSEATHQGKIDLEKIAAQGANQLAAVGAQGANQIAAIKANMTANEWAEKQGFARAIALQGIQSKGNFLQSGFDSVMQYGNNPNFTPEQSAAAVASGLDWLKSTFNIMDAFYASIGAPSDGQPVYPYSDPSTFDYGVYMSGGGGG